jgi:hypothetical protein
MGMQDVPWDNLEVRSTGAADKHVIEVRLETANSMHLEEDEEGKPLPFRYIYNLDRTNVSHGMRMTTDTLAETEEYVEALKAAVAFARRVNTWLEQHPEWTDRVESKKARLEVYKKDQLEE